MHDLYCTQHIQTYEALGWDCLVVVRDEVEIVGSVEICYTREPEPFGVYGHLEVLELVEDIMIDEVESWLLEQCEKRAGNRGFKRFWCRPEGSGGSRLLLAGRGYQELWRSTWLTVRELDSMQLPISRDDGLNGDYSEDAAHLLALNHRESAEYRWRYLWRPVLTPDASDFPTRVRFWGKRTTLDGRPSGICLVNIQSWRDPKSASADLWVEPQLADDVEYISGLIEVAGKQAHSMRADTLDIVVPEPISAVIKQRYGAGSQPLDGGDPGLRKDLTN